MIFEYNVSRSAAEKREEVNMRKIKDKHTLGVISGFIGGIAMLVADHISNKYLKISKRSYTDASAGMWVGTTKH